MSWLVQNKVKIKALLKALNEAEGLPLRGKTVGGPECVQQEPNRDEEGNILPTPGWTTSVIPDPIEVDDLLALEIPEEIKKKYFGKTIKIKGKDFKLPTENELTTDETKFPTVLKEMLAARKSVMPEEVTIKDTKKNKGT